MALQHDEAWVREYCERTGKPLPKELQKEMAAEEPKPDRPEKRSKYGNHRVTVDGVQFDSKHEAGRYQELMLMLRAGEIYGVFLQHSFLLPGDVVYKADFVVLEHGGTYRVEDAKSSATAKDKTYRIKKRLMRECLGLEIVEV